MGSTEALPAEEYANIALHRICLHLPALAEYLNSSRGHPHPCGRARLEIVSLVIGLVKTGRRMALLAIKQSQIVSRCLDLFFKHPWNCILHNSVTTLVSEVLATGASAGEGRELVHGLLQRGGLAETLVQEYVRDAGCKRGRVGYMAHLHLICTRLHDFCACVPDCSGAVFPVTGWFDLVVPSARATLEVYASELVPRDVPKRKEKRKK